MLRKFFAAVIVMFLVVMPHELGHFASARALGVSVDRLSIGFGPTALCSRPSVTEYCLSWFPLGGYVSLMDGGTRGSYSQRELIEIAARSPNYFAALANPSGWISGKSSFAQFGIAASGTLVNFLLIIALTPFLIKYVRSDELKLKDFEIIERESSRSFIGPIGLLKIAGRAGEGGLAGILSLTARFSLAIGVLQLWPIPFFDGQHLIDALFAALKQGQFDQVFGMSIWVVVLRISYLMAKARLQAIQGFLVLKERQSSNPVKRFIDRMISGPRS